MAYSKRAQHGSHQIMATLSCPRNTRAAQNGLDTTAFQPCMLTSPPLPVCLSSGPRPSFSNILLSFISYSFCSSLGGQRSKKLQVRLSRPLCSGFRRPQSVTNVGLTSTDLNGSSLSGMTSSLFWELLDLTKPTCVFERVLSGIFFLLKCW